MRERITINRNNYAVSATGQRATDGTPTTVATLWSEVRKVTDDQDMVGSFNTIENIYEFTVRNQTNEGITFQKKDLIVWDSNTYQVIGISDQSLHKRLVKLKAANVD